MAFEIQLPLGTSGLTDIYAVGIEPGGVASSNIPLSEIGTTGIYGNPTAITALTQDETYTIAAYQTSTLLAMAGPVVWDGTGFDAPIASEVNVARTAAESTDGKLTSDRLNNIDSLANPDTFKAIIPSVVNANITQVAGGTVANIAAFHGFAASDRDGATELQEAYFGGFQIFPDTNQAVHFARSGGAEIQRFNLFDRDGNPATERVFRREVVN